MPSRSAPGGNLGSGTGQRERRCSCGGQAHGQGGPCRRGSAPWRLTDAGSGTPGIGSPESASGTTGGLLDGRTTSARLADSGCWRAQDRIRSSEGRSSQLRSDTRRTRGAGQSETVRSDRVGDRTPEPVTEQEERCHFDNVGAPGRIRTFDLALRRRALYPLSYEGTGADCSTGRPAATRRTRRCRRPPPDGPAQTSRCRASARSTSRWVIPPALCVLSRSVTLL